jgi:type II secretory ATPase GspE/PulE/Tfp pilus assembly ATPase PilB-like protein
MYTQGVTKEPSKNIIALVDSFIHEAISRNASDIHLESTEQGLRVRYRIDGVLYIQQTIESAIMNQVLSRIKLISHINIAEKRVPQDGKLCMKLENRMIDLRISTFPSIHGEKIVIRILDRSHNNIDLEHLGFGQPLLTDFKSLIARSHGFLLVTGPTGSGKTTTLYAALAAMRRQEENIVTLEDPVEYNLDGITQGQVHPDAGFTFEKGIRAMLRQDPDVIMIGEIRDKQTAHIAIEAALTGHVVLSTLHTNDSTSAIMRLMDMGIEPFLINASITGVLAQRLARKICTSCRVPVRPSSHDRIVMHSLGMNAEIIYRGVGCAHCFKLGYKGRVGIFELLVMTHALRALIVQQPIFDALHAQALKDGLKPLLSDGAYKVQQGIISLEELVRVLA